MTSARTFLVAYHDGNRYLIEEESEIGFHLHRFVGNGPFSAHDYVHDTEREAKKLALEAWGVPFESWHAIL